MTTIFTKENIPNAAKLMESLRYSGYDNNIALADLVDNSLDANATLVDVSITNSQKEGISIVIADNGDGMDENILSQALRLGSITHRDVESDLGRFGMGLVTASISIAKRIEVYTKKSSGQMITSIMDIDEMAKVNNFNVYREKATTEEIRFFKSCGLDSQGTVIILKKCDKLSTPDINELIDSLKKDFGEIYRYFLRSGKRIRVNGSDIKILDPMWTDGALVEEHKTKKAEVFSDETFEIKTDGAEKKELLTVRVYVLPQFDPGIMRKLKINIKNQGFYVLRNYRQISKCDDMSGLWDKHNDLNRVRVELLFSGSLDGAMGVNYTKHNIKPIKAILDKIQNEVMPQINTLRNRFKKAHRSEESKDLNFDEAEKIISQKNKLLDKAEPDRKDNQTPLVPVVKKPRIKTEVPRPTKGRPSLANVARFENHNFGLSGPIFEVEKQGKITIVQWNVDHPFYERFLLEYKDNRDLTNAVSFLAYSLGEAKLKYTREETYEMLENIMSTISTNLRVLLS